MFQKRRQLLIHPRFQLRYSLFNVVSVVSLGIFYPLVIYYVFSYFIGLLYAQAQGTNAELLERVRLELLGILLPAQIVMLGILFVLSLIFSHRIVGPLDRLQQALEIYLSEGIWPRPMSTRARDQFERLIESFNRFVDRHQQKDQARRLASAQILEYFGDKNPDAPHLPPDVRTQLRSFVEG